MALVVAPAAEAVLPAGGRVNLTVISGTGILRLIFEICGRLSMRIGAGYLIEKFGSNLAVAEAFILGELSAHEQDYVSEVVDKITLQAAEIRLRALGKLNPADIKSSR